MKNWKFMKSGGVLLICGMVMSSTSAIAMTLDEYLAQVRGNNKGYKGVAGQAEGATLKSREADLYFTPKLFAEARWGEDYSIPQFEGAYKGIESQYYSLGIQQQFSFGLSAKVYYDLNYTEMRGVNASNPIAGAINTKYWDGKPKLELSLPLWGNGFGRTAEANSEAARASNLAEAYGADANATTMLINAEAAYWKLSAWQDVIKVNEYARTAAKNIYDYVARKKRMNLGEDADVMQASALVEGRELELQSAKFEYAQALRSFNKLLNRAPDTPVDNLQKIDYTAIEGLSIPKERPGSRPDVAATDAQLAAAKASATIVKERNRPTLDVYGTFGLMGKDEDLDKTYHDSWTDKYDSRYVGVRFNMPLNFMAANDAKRGADLSVKAAELNREYAYFSQEQDWNDLVNKIEEQKSNLKLLGRIETAQKTKLDSERLRLRQGRTTTYQVLMFEQDYSSAAANKVKAAAGILAMNAQLQLYKLNDETSKGGN